MRSGFRQGHLCRCSRFALIAHSSAQNRLLLTFGGKALWKMTEPTQFVLKEVVSFLDKPSIYLK